MRNYDLEPRYDSRKSFYGKAKIEADYPVVKLWSYSTNVATITFNGQPEDSGTLQVFGTYSNTTLRHIKEFMKQYGFKADNSKQIMADYGASR
jgi:hypothetical protein